MRKIVLILEYRGTNYCGFQWQSGSPTIQGEIEEALRNLTQERVRVIAASRTDSGVHARGQVVSFRTQSELGVGSLVSGLNHYLPPDIAVRAAYQMAGSLNIRKEAVSREYKYYILNSPTRSPLWEGLTHLVREKLDEGIMNEAARALLGEHDFSSFGSALGPEHLGRTRRRIYLAEVAREGELVVFTMVANSFLPHQVRNTVGSLIRVGLARMSLTEFYSIIEGKRVAPAESAPSSGLYLMRVNYPFSFEEKHNEDLLNQSI